ncbi:MAG: hypothetical protein ACE5FO_02435 [Parvularculaceae bacterium]
MSKRVLILAVASLTGLAAAASAATVRAASDPCTAPADASAYRLPETVEADDLNYWRIVAEEATPTIEIDVDDPTETRRVFERYEVDPETGAVFALPPAADCEETTEEGARR